MNYIICMCVCVCAKKYKKNTILKQEKNIKSACNLSTNRLNGLQSHQIICQRNCNLFSHLFLYKYLECYTQPKHFPIQREKKIKC